MPPTGGETRKRSGDIFGELWLWNKQQKLGIAFDSSTGFHLPNGSDRSPDAAWIKLERWNSLTPEQRQKFPPLAADFVVELRSASDDLKPLQEKTQEYINNSVHLGWLLTPRISKLKFTDPLKL